MRWPWNKPREIVLGKGEVMIATGVKDGRGFVFIRPAGEPGPLGETPSGYDPDFNTVRANRKDTIIWVEGPPENFIRDLRKAYAKGLP